MTENDVVRHFREELAKHRLEAGQPDHEGLYHLASAGLEMAVSLENVTLNAIRDNSFSPVDTLVQSIVSAASKPETFADVQDRLLLSLESNTILVGNSLSMRLTDQIEVRYVIDKGSQLLYVDTDDLKKWDVPVDPIATASHKNLDEFFLRAKISSSDVDGPVLYYRGDWLLLELVQSYLL